MSRFLGLVYGVFAYTLFFVSFVYLVGFLANLAVPKSIDSPQIAGVAASLTVNLLLLGLFAIQHSVMARPGFKAMWTRLVPPAFERSTYVLLSSLLLALIFWQWRPLPQVIWEIPPGPWRMAVQGLYWAGLLIGFLSTYMISHWDLFGLRQVFLNLRKRPYVALEFRIVAFYRLVRHPLMLGFVIAFWAAPTMSLGHLVFAAAMTVYILVALQFEERDLVESVGQDYIEYKARVPMLLPWPRFGRGK